MTGVSLTIKVDSIKAIQRLQRIQGGLESPRLMRVLGEVMRDSIEETFAQEGSPSGSWRKVHASTLGVQYANVGKKKGKKAFRANGSNTVGFLRFASGKKILQNMGHLKNSITYKSAGSQLLIGSNLKYARIHQLGGVIRAKSAKALRFPISTPAGIQWITKKSVTIPARPYLVFRPEDPLKLKEAVEDFLLE